MRVNDAARRGERGRVVTNEAIDPFTDLEPTSGELSQFLDELVIIKAEASSAK